MNIQRICGLLLLKQGPRVRAPFPPWPADRALNRSRPAFKRKKPRNATLAFSRTNV